LLPSIIGSVLTVVLLKIVIQKRGKGSNLLANLALLVISISLIVLGFWVYIFYQWSNSSGTQDTFTQGQGF
jgi:ABC-type Fe3+ transport system permease subunit